MNRGKALKFCSAGHNIQNQQQTTAKDKDVTQ
jgi:hypothetical protein